MTAGLQGIPRDLHEAAAVDGAGGIRRFWSITLPMLGPTLLFVVIVLTGRAFQAYGEIDLLTRGGPRPQYSTTTITYLTYGTDSIITNDVGLQAAVAVLLFGVLLVLSVVQLVGIGRQDPLCVSRPMSNDQVTYDTPTGLRAVGRYSLLVVVSVIVLFPIYTTVVAALKPGNQVLVNPLVPDAFTLDIFRQAWTDGNLGRYMLNSFVVAVIVTVAQVVTSVLSAYAFSILDWPGRNVVFVAFLATLLVPLEATLVVNRRTVDSLGWINSYQGLDRAVPGHRVRHVPHPPGVHDAAARPARRGGDRRRRAPRVPAPRRRAARAPDDRGDGLAGFLSTWNQYLWPNLVTTESDMYTLQSGLRALAQASGVDRPNLVMAGVIIAFLPIVHRAARLPAPARARAHVGRGEGMSAVGARCVARRLCASLAACGSGESLLEAGNDDAPHGADVEHRPAGHGRAGRDAARRRRPRRP